MKRIPILVAAITALPVLADGITLYEGPNMRGRSVSLSRSTPNLGYLGFENKAASAYVTDGRWELCTEPYFKGQCRPYGPGQKPSLDGQSYRFSSARIAFEHGNFGGRSVWIERTTSNFDRMGFNDRAESVIVEGGSWRLGSDANGRGECEEFGPGQYPTLPRGLASKISSAYVR